MRSLLIQAVLICFLTSNAYADPKEDCEKGINWEMRIAACTSIIESKEPVLARGLPQAIPLLRRAQAHRAKGEYDRAIADYTQAIAYNPDIDYLILRGDAYMDKRDFDNAIADYSSAISQFPGTLEPDKTYYFKRAAAYDAKGYNDRAIADFTRVIDISRQSGSEDQDAYFLRGISRYSSGEFRFAAYDFVAHRSFANSKQQEYYNVIFYYLALARSKGEAVPAILKDFAVGSNKSKWPYPVVELLLDERRPDDTLSAASDADQRCEAHFYIGQWHLLKGRQSDAESSLKAAVSSCPTNFIEYYSAVAELKLLKK